MSLSPATPPPAAEPTTPAGGTDGPAVGDLIELDVGAIATGGGCVGRAPDGRVVFVRHSIPGERVVARVTAVTNNFLRADVDRVLDASPDRRDPPCPHAGSGRCGGCDWQHIDLERQRELKAELIAEQLKRIARIEHLVVVEALPGDERGLGWRTRVRFAVDRTGRVGLRQHRSHDIEVLEDCLLSAPELRALGIEEARWRGVSEVEGFASGPGAGAEEHEHGGATVLVVPGRDGVRVGDLPTGLGEAGIVVEDQVIREPRALHTRVRGRRFRVSAGSFWQVHTEAPEVLADALLEALGARAGDHVADLYAGVGLFSVLIGEKVGKDGRVLSVERSKTSSADARRNASSMPQIEIWSREVDVRLVSELAGSDLIVLDPPREGAGRAVTTALATLRPTPRRIVYLSCDPASFARDLRAALDERWSMTSLRAFDLFPMTEHVELLAVLEPGG